MNITLTTSQVKAANSIARNMKRNKSENAEQLVKKVINAYLVNNFELIAKAAKEVAAREFDRAIEMGGEFKINRAEYIAAQTREALDILETLKNGEPKK